MIDSFHDFLCRVDTDFPTSLSARVDLRDYALKLLRNAWVQASIKEDKIAGMVAMYCNDTANKYAYIPLVAVDKEWRGQKLSKALMSSAILYAKENGFRTLGLHTENTIALKLYLSLGFKVIEEGQRKYLELNLV